MVIFFNEELYQNLFDGMDIAYIVRKRFLTQFTFNLFKDGDIFVSHLILSKFRRRIF